MKFGRAAYKRKKRRQLGAMRPEVVAVWPRDGRSHGNAPRLCTWGRGAAMSVMLMRSQVRDELRLLIVTLLIRGHLRLVMKCVVNLARLLLQELRALLAAVTTISVREERPCASLRT